jgi:hypothetical protein
MSQQQAELVEKCLTSRHLPSERRQLWKRNTERRGCDKQVRPSVAAKRSAEEEREREGLSKCVFALSTDRMVVRVRDQAQVEGERAACTNSRDGWKERRCRD